jgi:TonB family protein
MADPSTAEETVSERHVTAASLAVGLLFVIVCASGACSQNPPAASPTPAAPDRTRDVQGLHFDPQGADFTLWVLKFKDEVYSNWIVPESFIRTTERGPVDFEFTVARDGSVSLVRVLRSSGWPELDRAAAKALTASHFTALPRDYRPAHLTMQVTFNYGKASR